MNQQKTGNKHRQYGTEWVATRPKKERQWGTLALSSLGRQQSPSTVDFVHVMFTTFSHFLEVMRSSPRETLSQTTSTFASLAPSKFSSQIQRRSVKGGALVLLMEEILHQLGCRKPCKWWDKLPINWCRISSINSSLLFGWECLECSGCNYEIRTAVQLFDVIWCCPMLSREKSGG